MKYRTKRPLRLFKPLKKSQHVFLPRASFIRSGREEKVSRDALALGDRLYGMRERATTPPVYEEPYEAAWDPRSKTPPLRCNANEALSSLEPPAYEHRGHWATTQDSRGANYERSSTVNQKLSSHGMPGITALLKSI